MRYWSGPAEIKLQITISTDKTVLELKQAIAEKTEVEAERQRLIYSGRVLKDEEGLSTYKIASGHTIHMVKGVNRSAAASSGASSSTPQQLPTMQAGQNVHDPLTQLNGHQGFGLMAGLNPFADMGVNPNDPNMIQTMMSSPEVMQQMAGMLSNPQVVDTIIASNPQLQAMGPQVRQMFQSEGFRQMLADPQRLRQMMEMSAMMRGGDLGALGGGAGAFPAPGVPGGASATGTPSSPSTGTPNAANPPFNPFSMFGGLGAGGFGAPPGAPAAGAGPDTNAFNPAALQSLFGGGGGFGGFGGMGAGAGGWGAPAAPADTRPPEERFETQLQQLQGMGFVNAQQNIRALQATGGNVNSAVEYILGGGGL
ncbi:ubiquitin-domain-containing protein [Cylindrobasidium torrendii FP15055 ss-10]|uniref:Ubiquitin-domain-containing protein n=1 Tax=Cylindrobasidium torrendii FP15055 ss-10 TaxID=1314674 RepID=A0A0D7BFL0_9AGAR|nr:ubiquitin-domain-containing protein [Cylindrobasidium torrendii FP15055 ss-10]